MNDSKDKPINPAVTQLLERAGIPAPLQINLPGELAQRLRDEANRKKIQPDQLLVEIVNKYLSKRK